MLIILSPATSLDYETEFKCLDFSEIFFKKDVELLSSQLKKIKLSEIEKMMEVSPKLAELNFARFQNFSKKFDL